MISIEDLKKYLKIDSSDTSKDNQLNLAIQNANGFLEGFLGYSLEFNESKIAFFSGFDNSFELNNVHINGVSKIEYAENEFEETFTEYTLAQKVYLERGLVKTQENIGNIVKITYSFGYDESSCPGDLKMALLDIAAMSFKNMGRVGMGDLKSETVDGDEITFKDVAGRLSENTQIILNKYKKYGFSS